ELARVDVHLVGGDYDVRDLGVVRAALRERRSGDGKCGRPDKAQEFHGVLLGGMEWPARRRAPSAPHWMNLARGSFPGGFPGEPRIGYGRGDVFRKAAP